MNKNIETELKLLISKGNLKKLLATDLFKQIVRPDSEKKRRLVSSYYDTDDFALKKHGIAYRVRDKGDGTFEATVKASRKSSGGLSERLELNLPLTEDKAVLEGFAELGLGYELTELAGDGVAKLFTVDVERVTYLLDFEGAVMELAVDNGKISAAKKADIIEEVEIELAEGDKGALLKLAAQIAELVPVFTEKRSKFARGLALLGIAADEAAVKTKIAKTDSIRRGFLRAAQARCDNLLAQQNVVKSGKADLKTFKEMTKNLVYLRSYLYFGSVFAFADMVQEAADIAEEWLSALHKAQTIAALREMWQSIVEDNAEALKNNVLTGKLSEAYEDAVKDLQKLAKKGSLSQAAYKTIYWLYEEPWQNEEYLSAESTVRCRLQDWQEEAAGETADKILLLANMACVAKSMQGKTFAKTAAANRKEYRRLVKEKEVEVMQDLLLALGRGSNSRVLNRDTGVVLGWLMAHKK